jgi:molybdate transport system ATP-binding protein
MTHVRVSRKTSTGLSLDVDLPIPAGISAIYGPSGAGKSLLLGSIAGFATPDSGRILLDDAILFDAAAGVSLPPRRRSIGYIFPKLALFPHMTLERNIAFAAAGRPRLERHRRVTEMLHRFDLAAAAALDPGTASPDQRLGCAIARALISEPKLLLIDNAGIDESVLARIRDVFANPILLATRDLDLCSASASDLVLLEAGRVVQRGLAGAVLDSPESIEAARLLGIPNIFEGSIAVLDPGRNFSRLDFEDFSLAGPYIPGHFRGARISIAVRADALRVHPAEAPGVVNCVPVRLLRASERVRYIRMEFAEGISADVPRADYARLKDTQSLHVEFPVEALRVL